MLTTIPRNSDTVSRSAFIERRQFVEFGNVAQGREIRDERIFLLLRNGPSLQILKCYVYDRRL
jgi:hypothetical protein